MNIVNKFKDWKQPRKATAADIIKAYEDGFRGASYSPEEQERFVSEQPNPVAEDICHSLGYAESAKGELVSPWEHVERIYPDCWPAAPQRQGDCVAHDQRNTQLTTHVGEIVAGLPDEVSGKREGPVEVSEAGRKDGVFCIEPMYRHRGHRGHGWFCPAAARISTSKAGACIRKNYTGHADLTKYNPRWAAGAARSAEVDTFDDNLFREASQVSTFEAIRDLLDRGFGISSCGGESFAKTRDANGLSKRTRGGWAHAMSIIGADDRRWVYVTYGGPLVLILNSWGKNWINGPREVKNSKLLIPKGAFWARWEDVKRRTFTALSGLNGWERNRIVDYTPGWES